LERGPTAATEIEHVNISPDVLRMEAYNSQLSAHKSYLKYSQATSTMHHILLKVTMCCKKNPDSPDKDSLEVLRKSSIVIDRSTTTINNMTSQSGTRAYQNHMNHTT
jgi:hypothetical protein